MGYYSDWKIGICASSEAKLNEVIYWMEFYVKCSPVAQDKKEVMEYILSCRTDIHRGADENNVTFGDGSKCYDPWDSVLGDIKDFVRNDDELDMGYARIGEQLDDVETWSKDYCYPNIVREIADFDFHAPQKKAMPATTSVAAQQSAPSKKKEEQCQMPGCGRMKDIGSKCWACGN